MRIDIEQLKEAAIYPGHPVTLALCIVLKYASLEDANMIPPGCQFGAALGDSDIPGAGGCVGSALWLLDRLCGGVPWGEAVMMADETWASCDSNRAQKPAHWLRGQEQADRLKPVLREQLAKRWGMSFTEQAA